MSNLLIFGLLLCFIAVILLLGISIRLLDRILYHTYRMSKAADVTKLQTIKTNQGIEILKMKINLMIANQNQDRS